MTEKKTYVLTVSKAFMQKHPRAGQPTEFKDKILTGQKIHTIRDNYEYWSKIVNAVNEGKAFLSVRQWSGKPYNSKQVEICQYHTLGLQKFSTDENGVISIDGYYTDADYAAIAINDGLSEPDFYAWFPMGKPFEGAIIHFTPFRYD